MSSLIFGMLVALSPVGGSQAMADDGGVKEQPRKMYSCKCIIARRFGNSKPMRNADAVGELINEQQETENTLSGNPLCRMNTVQSEKGVTTENALWVAVGTDLVGNKFAQVSLEERDVPDVKRNGIKVRSLAKSRTVFDGKKLPKEFALDVSAGGPADPANSGDVTFPIEASGSVICTLFN
jgi:hypothetical protein